KLSPRRTIRNPPSATSTTRTTSEPEGFREHRRFVGIGPRRPGMGARLEASTPQREAPDIAVALTRPSPLHHTHPTSPRIGHPPFVICHLPSAICHPPFAIRTFAIRHSPFRIPHSPERALKKIRITARFRTFFVGARQLVRNHEPVLALPQDP